MQSVMWMILWCTNSARAMFFHEKSSIVLAPAGENNNISFGYSLAYQRGEHPSLVIGAPLYDLTGRVYQRSIHEILNGTTSCDPLDIDFAALNITYDRSLSPEQHFYLGASIAATEKFFVTCAPLRTAYGNNERYANGTYHQKFGAYGVCFVYDHTKTPRACQNYGLDYFLKQDKIITNSMYGGSGWSSLVDENKHKILISKSFNKHDVSHSTFNPRQSYISVKDGSKSNLPTTKDVINYGKAMTVGNYFKKNVKTTYYAFSSRDMFGRGAIDFYSSDNKWDKPVYRYEDTGVGSMFGASLWSADVTGPEGSADGCADLLVGAPAQVADARGFDRGAVHLLTKFNSDNNKIMVMKLTIRGAKDGGRFGTTLATNDVDGDSYPEIIISAPFEESGVGALYILCGYGVHTILKKDVKVVHVFELERTQRIAMETQKSFGFSFQPVADFNDNASDELGVGAPDSSRVTLFLGLRAITVKVTSRFPNTGSDSDLGSSFVDFSSCFTVDLPLKPKIIRMKLLVNNVLIGKGALNDSKDASYEIDLATDNGTEIAGKLTEYCRQIRIVNASSYKMNTTVSAVENIQEQNEFESTWVTFSAQSNLTKETTFECECKEGCAPKFSTELHWSGGDISDGTYIVGSSQSETVNVRVRNTGTRGCGNCAVVSVSGQLYQLLCASTGVARQYECALPSPFIGNSSANFEIQLSMGTLSNQDNNLTIDVEVRENCDKPEPKAQTSLMVLYNFTKVLDNLIINGTSMDGVITDTDVQDRTEEIIFHEQTYTILNNQAFTWKNMGVNVSASNEQYIQNFRVTIKHTENYDEYNGTEDYFWRSTLTVSPYSMIKVTISTSISKEKLALYLQNGQNITLQSELALDLLADKSINKKLTTVLTFKKEMTIWNNKMLITILALSVALLILIIIIVILYKKKFFVRKNKQKLKREIRRRSIRRESSRRRPPSTHEAGAQKEASEMESLVMAEGSSPPRDPQGHSASTAHAPHDAPAQ